MDILNEIDELTKQLSHTFLPLKNKDSIIRQIQEAPILRHLLGKEIAKHVKKCIEEGSLFSNMLYVFFSYNHYRDEHSFMFTGSDEKQLILNEIRNALYQVKLCEPEYGYFFKNQMILPKKERLKRVVSGKKTDNFIWIEQREMDDILSHFFEITLLTFEEHLKIDNPYRIKFLLTHVFALCEHPYAVSLNLSKLLSESFLIEMIAENHEDLDEIKSFAKKWYQEKGKKLIQLFNYRRHSYCYAKEYFYLLTDSQLKQTKEQFLSIYRKQLDLIKESPKHQQKNALVKLKKSILKLELEGMN